MIHTGEAALCFEPFSKAWQERHVWVGFTFQSGWQMLSFHRIADRFKVIANTDKTNILLLSVVSFLPSLGSWKPFFIIAFYLRFSWTFLLKSFCSYHRENSVYFFFYPLNFTSHEWFGAYCFLAMARSCVTILLCLPGSHGCHHCEARDRVPLHCSPSSIWTRSVRATCESLLQPEQLLVFLLGFGCWHWLLSGFICLKTC